MYYWGTICHRDERRSFVNINLWELVLCYGRPSSLKSIFENWFCAMEGLHHFSCSSSLQTYPVDGYQSYGCVTQTFFTCWFWNMRPRSGHGTQKKHLLVIKYAVTKWLWQPEFFSEGYYNMNFSLKKSMTPPPCQSKKKYDPPLCKSKKKSDPPIWTDPPPLVINVASLSGPRK